MVKEVIDFSRLKRRGSPNKYLCYPTGFDCALAADDSSPHFAVDATQLQDCWRKLLKNERSVTIIQDDAASRSIECIQRSRVFRFPDKISVQFIVVTKEKSSLAIYSRSKYGYYDLGVNRRRVLLWLKQLSYLTNKA